MGSRIFRARPGPGRRCAATTVAALLAAPLAAVALPLGGTPAAAAPAPPDVIVVDTGDQRGPLRKAGLGTLFGIASIPDTPRDLAIGSQQVLAQHQSPDGDASYPTGTEAVAAKLRGSGIRMTGRYNDLMGGWPYVWKGIADWDATVDSATRSIQRYRETMLGVSPFNEPDNKLTGLAGDASVPGATYDAKVNWLWTRSVRRIRAIDPTIPVIGPAYEFFLPWSAAQNSTARMTAFLRSAKDTGTLPQIMDWHNLGPSPGDVPEALRTYRRIERDLGVGPLPVYVEEYGPQTDDRAHTAGNFEGVPGTMVKHWAEFARYDVEHAAMGTYTNPGLLGNALRRRYPNRLVPNGGWHMMNWFQQLRGVELGVSRWDTRGYLRSDGVAGWDAAARQVTVIAGTGASYDAAGNPLPTVDRDVDVRLTGMRARGLGERVRVRVDRTKWDHDPARTLDRVDLGGDPQTGTYNLVDKTYALDAAGNLTVPIHQMQAYDGYRVTVTPEAPAASYPTKYEAERARVTDAVLHTGSDARWLASADGYVGGIDGAGSAVEFTVTAPDTGIYRLNTRYAAAAAATHTVTVNGVRQRDLSLPPSGGWMNDTARTADGPVLLARGANTIRIGKGAGNAELDFIDVRPDTHRYEAEFAALAGSARRTPFAWNFLPDYVGRIDSADAAVEFTVDAPAAGRYTALVGHGSKGAGATHAVTVNGAPQGTVRYAATADWLSGRTQDAVAGQAAVPVTLRTGRNVIRLAKAGGFAELDYLHLVADPAAVPDPTPAPTPTPTPTPTATPAPGGCTATMTLQNAWGSGFVADVTVRATRPVSGWTVTWTWPGGQRVTSSWNAELAGTTAMTARSTAFNGSLPAGGTAAFGLQADGAPATPALACSAR